MNTCETYFYTNHRFLFNRLFTFPFSKRQNMKYLKILTKIVKILSSILILFLYFFNV
jgi:hypothetical protein